MDPQAVLRELLYALENGDRADAIAACETLFEWMERDGFLPTANEIELDTGMLVFKV